MLNGRLGFTCDKRLHGGFTGDQMSASNRMLNLVFDSGADCRRQWPRQLMLLSARLITVTSDRAIRIRDLSPGGARIEGNDIPPVDTDVLIKRGSFEAFGTIAWNSGGQAGVEFETPLDEEAYEALQQPRHPELEPERETSRRPGFGRKTGEHRRYSDGSGWIDL